LVYPCMNRIKLRYITMETSTKTNIALKAIELELKRILSEDLAQFRAAKKDNNQGSVKQAA